MAAEPQESIPTYVEEHPIEGKGWRLMTKVFGGATCIIGDGLTTRERADKAKQDIDAFMPLTVNQAKRVAERIGY